MYILKVELPIDSLMIVAEGTIYGMGRTEEEQLKSVEKIKHVLLECSGLIAEDMHIEQWDDEAWERRFNHLESQLMNDRDKYITNSIIDTEDLKREV